MHTKSNFLKAALLSGLLGAAFAASAQATRITPSEPNVAAPATAPKGEGSRDRAAVRAEGKTAKAAPNEGGEAANEAKAAAARRASRDKSVTAKARSETAESRSGQQSDVQQPGAAKSTRSKAEVRAEGRKEKIKAVGGGGTE